MDISEWREAVDILDRQVVAEKSFQRVGQVETHIGSPGNLTCCR